METNKHIYVYTHKKISKISTVHLDFMSFSEDLND